MGLSDIRVAGLIHAHFLANAFSMSLLGPMVDADGRRLVEETWPEGVPTFLAPDLLVVDGHGGVLGRLGAGASPDDHVALLARLAGCEAPPVHPLEQRFRDGEREGLLPALEAVLARGTHSDEDALARCLLGAVRTHLGQDGTGVWRSVLDRYPDSPLRHRVQYNLFDRAAVWATPTHPDLMGVTRAPSVVTLDVPSAAWTPPVVAGPVVQGLPFVKVPAGSFWMGGEGFVREQPLRRVTLTQGFYLSAWPVTRAVYARVVGAPAPAHPHRPQHGLSWSEAVAVAEALGGRLPTEAEWEYAARGGLEGKRHPWGDAPPTPERSGHLHREPTEVGRCAPNGFGLYDMVGNGLQWTADRYADDAYAQTPIEVVDPTGPTQAELPGHYAVRGGMIGSAMAGFMARCAFRVGFEDCVRGEQGRAIGFRVLLPLDAPVLREDSGV